MDDENNHVFSNFYLLDNNDNNNKKNDSIIKNKLKDEILNMLRMEIANNSFREKLIKEEIEEIKNLYETKNQNNSNQPVDLITINKDIFKFIKNELEEEANQKICFEYNKFKKELLLIIKNEFDSFNVFYDNKLNDKENALQINIREEIINLLKNHFEQKLNEEEKLVQMFKLKIAENEKLYKEKDEAEYSKLREDLLTSVANVNIDIMKQANKIKSIEDNTNNKINKILSFNQKNSLDLESKFREQMKDTFISYEISLKEIHNHINISKNELLVVNKKVDCLEFVKKEDITDVRESLIKKMDETSKMAIINFEKKLNERNLLEEKKLKLEIVSIIKEEIETKFRVEEAAKEEEKDSLYKNIEKDITSIREELLENMKNEIRELIKESFDKMKEILLKEKLEENKNVSVELSSNFDLEKIKAKNLRQVKYNHN